MQKYYNIRTDEGADCATVALLIKHLVEGDSLNCLDTNEGPELVELCQLLTI